MMRADARCFSIATARSSKKPATSIGSTGWCSFPTASTPSALLNRAGFAVVVVTNQAGIARGIFDEAFVAEAHRHIAGALAAGGARIDALLLLPAPSRGASIEAYRQACDCRKPQPGLLRARCGGSRARSARDSFVVGDRWHDVAAGQRRRRARRARAHRLGASTKQAPHAAAHAGRDRRQPDGRRRVDSADSHDEAHSVDASIRDVCSR